MKKVVNNIFHWYYRKRYERICQGVANPQRVQMQWLRHLLKAASWTEWGKAHQFARIHSWEDYATRVPLQEYEDVKPFINRMMHGEKDVLWSGRVKWFSKSSGTTSDKSKFIPVTSHNLKYCHLRGSWDTMALFYHNRPDARQFECKSMLMGGSLSPFAPYPSSTVGDISAIMINAMPYVARPFFAPDVKTALLDDWEEKLDRLVVHGTHEDSIVMIGGVPTWTVVLMKRILAQTGKKHMLEVWPHFQGYIHGGVNFEPYREQFDALFPSPAVSFQEIYNASEGYFAAQDRFGTEGMLLFIDNGIFYEFLPLEEWNRPNGQPIPLWEVEPHKHYALVISTNSGLWRYMPGDTVKFVSTNPYRLKVTGRTKQFINAFGEEVMIENVESAIAQTCRDLGVLVSEYTVAPQYISGHQKGGHQWLIEFEKPPNDLKVFAHHLDQNLQALNSDYQAKRYKDIALVCLKIDALPKGTFLEWLKAKGKVGAQHKVPRLSNNRVYIEEIMKFLGNEV